MHSISHLHLEKGRKYKYLNAHLKLLEFLFPYNSVSQTVDWGLLVGHGPVLGGLQKVFETLKKTLASILPQFAEDNC